jgi:hypothetical protein
LMAPCALHANSRTMWQVQHIHTKRHT